MFSDRRTVDVAVYRSGICFLVFFLIQQIRECEMWVHRGNMLRTGNNDKIFLCILFLSFDVLHTFSFYIYIVRQCICILMLFYSMWFMGFTVSVAQELLCNHCVCYCECPSSCFSLSAMCAIIGTIKTQLVLFVQFYFVPLFKR